MKRIIVTPAGRKRYLAILIKYLVKQKHSFDSWQIWCNTIKSIKSQKNETCILVHQIFSLINIT